MNRIKLALVAGGVLFATPAFAQDPDPNADPAAGGTVEAGAGAEVTTPTGDGTATVDATAGAAMSWSRSAIDRPYVLNKGKIGAYLGYSIASISFQLDPTMPATTITADGFGVGAGYGLTDKITAGLQYSFTPGIIGDGESEIKGDLDIFGMFQIMRDAKMDITATAAFSLGLASDPIGKGISAGLGARYNLAPKMALFTGGPYGPGPVGQHLQISLDTDGPITFSLPVGFMFQATPELNIYAMTNLTTIAISNAGDTTFFGADYIPLFLGGLFSVTPNIDVTADFGLPDLKEAGFDLYIFSIGARYYN